MRTADLIDSLATDVRPVAGERPIALLAKAAAVGGAVSLVFVVLLYGVQPGLAGDARMMPFAMKAGYAAVLGAIALAAAARLTRPDGDAGGWRALAWPVAALGVVAAWRLASAPVGVEQALLGSTWNQCPLRIAALSLPVMATLFAVVRRQAPTDLRRAGAAVGLAAGAVSSVVYALACTENSPAFVLVWYSLGMALATAIGALLGPRLLRW